MDTVTVNRSPLHHSRALPSARAFTLGLAATLFVLLCVLPVVYMFVVSLIDAAGGFTLNNYQQYLTEPRQRELLLTSIVLGAGAAMFATVLGTPLGLLFARAPLPAKRFLRIALIVPLVVLTYIMALAWVLLTGPVGLLARATGRDSCTRRDRVDEVLRMVHMAPHADKYPRQLSGGKQQKGRDRAGNSRAFTIAVVGRSALEFGCGPHSCVAARIVQPTTTA